MNIQQYKVSFNIINAKFAKKRNTSFIRWNFFTWIVKLKKCYFFILGFNTNYMLLNNLLKTVKKYFDIDLAKCKISVIYYLKN